MGRNLDGRTFMVRHHLQSDQLSGHHIFSSNPSVEGSWQSAALLCIIKGDVCPKSSLNTSSTDCGKQLLRHGCLIAAGDVFRFPSYPSLFSACVGTGTQVRHTSVHCIFLLHVLQTGRPCSCLPLLSQSCHDGAEGLCTIIDSACPGVWRRPPQLVL